MNNNKSKIKNNYSSIDLMKFISAFLVVVIHTSPFKSIDSNLDFFFSNILARIAVPFFFVCGGYFFARGIVYANYEKKYFLKKMNNLITLYVFWSIVYLPFSFFYPLYKGVNVGDLIRDYIKYFFLHGSYFHLWYMVALIFAFIILYYVIVQGRLKKLFLLSIIIYIIGLLGQPYYELASKIQVIKNIFELYFSLFQSTRNGLFFGLPYVFMGAYIFIYKDLTQRKMDIFFAILFFVLYIVEGFTLYWFKLVNGLNMSIFLYPFIYFLFKILLTTNLNISKSTGVLLRRCSMNIYFSHAIFLFVYATLFGRLNINNSLLFFVLNSVSTFLFVWLIQKSNNSFVNKFI